MLGLTESEWRLSVVYSAIVLFLWAVYICVFNLWLKLRIFETKLVLLPQHVKCFWRTPKCLHADVDVYSIVHVLIYLVVGILIPGKYIHVLVISLAFEALEHISGIRPRYWQDPLANMIGYAIGNAISGRRSSEELRASALAAARDHRIFAGAAISIVVMMIAFLLLR